MFGWSLQAATTSRLLRRTSPLTSVGGTFIPKKVSRTWRHDLTRDAVPLVVGCGCSIDGKQLLARDLERAATEPRFRALSKEASAQRAALLRSAAEGPAMGQARRRVLVLRIPETP